MSDINYEHHGAVRLITINRAAKMNSLDFAANDELVAVWREFENDDEARVAVITGAGDKAFCAGADLTNYTLNFAQAPAPEFRRKFTNGPGFGGITRNLDIDKPILAAINGFAISGGFELSLACDIRFCSPNAEFALQDAKWGFHACDGGLIRLPQIVGMGHAMEIILSGERVDAEHALRIGLVNRIYAQNELLAKTLAYAQMLASRSPLSQRFAKEVVRRSVGMHMDEALKWESRSFRDVAFTDDLKEGLASFKERRPADFKGS
ncbi:MAG: enoyl-CoA hydratase-related protein [Burkholderiales bacterium]|nr:enoyl-CoA hydratase-related protein [Burkholderiales bacterium]